MKPPQPARGHGPALAAEVRRRELRASMVLPPAAQRCEEDEAERSVIDCQNKTNVKPRTHITENKLHSRRNDGKPRKWQTHSHDFCKSSSQGL